MSGLRPLLRAGEGRGGPWSLVPGALSERGLHAPNPLLLASRLEAAWYLRNRRTPRPHRNDDTPTTALGPETRDQGPETGLPLRRWEQRDLTPADLTVPHTHALFNSSPTPPAPGTM